MKNPISCINAALLVTAVERNFRNLRTTRTLLAAIFVFHCTRCLFAGQLPPLTVKEISLMLRSGYSSETILRDLSARHFADRLDAVAEKELTGANASSELLDALKSGNNAASAEEAARLRQKQRNASRSQELGKNLITSGQPIALPNGDNVNYAPARPLNSTQTSPHGNFAETVHVAGRYRIELADAEKAVRTAPNPCSRGIALVKLRGIQIADDDQAAANQTQALINAASTQCDAFVVEQEFLDKVRAAAADGAASGAFRP